jgi:hypothetical protein
MPALGIGVAFLGYTLFYYGVTQVRGENYGFLDLLLPGKFSKIVSGVKPAKDGEKPASSIPPATPAEHAQNMYEGPTQATPSVTGSTTGNSPADVYKRGGFVR